MKDHNKVIVVGAVGVIASIASLLNSFSKLFILITCFVLLFMTYLASIQTKRINDHKPYCNKPL